MFPLRITLYFPQKTVNINPIMDVMSVSKKTIIKIYYGIVLKPLHLLPKQLPMESTIMMILVNMCMLKAPLDPQHHHMCTLSDLREVMAAMAEKVMAAVPVVLDPTDPEARKDPADQAVSKDSIFYILKTISKQYTYILQDLKDLMAHLVLPDHQVC